MPLVTLSPFIISLQDLNILFHIALTRLEMPDFSLKISLKQSARTPPATAPGQARLEAHELKRSRNPQKQSNFAQALMKKIQFSSAAVISRNRGVFNLDEVRLKHMISPRAKHERQLQMSSKCRIEACTNVPLLGVKILGNCKEQ